MKHIFHILILISFSWIPIFSQEINATKIKGKGYIFPESHFIFGLYFEGVKSRTTPTEEDIKRAETTLSDSIDSFTGNYSPNIRKKNLKKYTRQYAGFVNKKGETIIYINLFRNIDREWKSELDKEILWILDGGDDYWQIFVNIEDKDLFGLIINGIS